MPDIDCVAERTVFDEGTSEKGLSDVTDLVPNDKDEHFPCLPQLSAQQVLLITLSTTGIFTCSQFTGAVLSNSLALYGDSCDMAIDTATYALNWWVERKRSQGGVTAAFVQTELWASLISALALIAVTLYLFYEGVSRVMEPSDEEEDPMYVVVFSSLNLAINVLQVGMFVQQFGLCSTRAAQVEPEAEAEAEWEEDAPEKQSGAPALNMNVASAAAHVGADTARTLTELVSAHLAVLAGFDPVVTDAWGSFVVNIFVLVSGTGLLYAVVKQWRSRCRGHHHEHASVSYEVIGNPVQLEVVSMHCDYSNVDAPDGSRGSYL